MNFDVKFQEESSFTVEMGQLTRGPKGEKGDKGDPGPTGPQGPKGDTGPQGESAADAVKYTAQELTDQQKSQARENIGAVGAEDVLQPDWAQNDATAKNYVKNRPGGFSTFTEEKVEIQYSGDYADEVYWGNAGGLRWVLAHSSDEIPTKEELAGATYTGTMAPQGALNVCDAGDKCYYANTTGGSLTANDPPPYAIVVTEAGTVVWGRTFSKAGVYLPDGNSSGGFSVKIDTLTYMKKTETPHAFPAKYIPSLEPLTVTFTKDDDGNWSADKTFAEVKAAIEAGRFVQAVVSGYVYPFPVGITDDQVIAFLLNLQGPDGITQFNAGMTPPSCVVVEMKGGLLPLDDTPVYEGKLAEKTDDMTQPVGVDAAGKLWTKPGGGSLTADGITTALGYTPRKAWYVKLTGTKASPTADQTAEAIYQAYTDGYAVYGIVQMNEVLNGLPIVLPLYAVSSGAIAALCFAGSANPHLSGTLEQNTTITATYDGSWHVFVDSQPTALKNPNALTIKIGSETVTYDGSAAKTVEIADGGNETWESVTFTIPEGSPVSVATFDLPSANITKAVIQISLFGTLESTKFGVMVFIGDKTGDGHLPAEINDFYTSAQNVRTGVITLEKQAGFWRSIYNTMAVFGGRNTTAALRLTDYKSDYLYLRTTTTNETFYGTIKVHYITGGSV